GVAYAQLPVLIITSPSVEHKGILVDPALAHQFKHTAHGRTFPARCPVSRSILSIDARSWHKNSPLAFIGQTEEWRFLHVPVHIQIVVAREGHQEIGTHAEEIRDKSVVGD